MQRQGCPIANGVTERVTGGVAALILGCTEPHECVAVSPVNRCACQTEEECIRKCRRHEAPKPSFLGPMGFVSHNDYVVAHVQIGRSLAKLMDRSYDDFPGSRCEELVQLIYAAGCYKIGHVGGVERRSDLKVKIGAINS